MTEPGNAWKSEEVVQVDAMQNPNVAVARRRSRKAIASLVCGCLWFLFPTAILAIVLGHLSRSDIRRSAGRLKGERMALAGLILGYAGGVIIPVLIIIAALIIPYVASPK
jgi:hypothetical protein